MLEVGFLQGKNLFELKYFIWDKVLYFRDNQARWWRHVYVLLQNLRMIRGWRIP